MILVTDDRETDTNQDRAIENAKGHLGLWPQQTDWRNNIRPVDQIAAGLNTFEIIKYLYIVQLEHYLMYYFDFPFCYQI